MPICFHVVPEPAARRMNAKISTSSSVRRWVLPSSSVISAATSTLIRSSRGSARRACTIGGTMRVNASMPSPSEVTASRMSRASPTDTPKLPVIVSSGIAEKNSTLRSAAPLGAMRSSSASIAPTTQRSVHHDARLGRNEGCTNARYRWCSAPSM